MRNKLILLLILICIWFVSSCDDSRRVFGYGAYRMAPPAKVVVHTPAHRVVPVRRWNYAGYGAGWFGWGYAQPNLFIRAFPRFVSFSTPRILIGRPYFAPFSNFARAFNLTLYNALTNCVHRVPISSGYCYRCYAPNRVVYYNRIASGLDNARLLAMKGKLAAADNAVQRAYEVLDDLPQEAAMLEPKFQAVVADDAETFAEGLLLLSAAVDHARFGFTGKEAQLVAANR